MNEDPRTEPLREWNRLARENTENAIVSSMFEASTKSSTLIEKFSTWLLVGAATVASFFIINSAFHKADMHHSITSYYLTNPEVKGINTQSSSWLTSPWHPRKITSDEARELFVNENIEWMNAWFQVLRVTRASSQ
jgi:hypothetical protein